MHPKAKKVMKEFGAGELHSGSKAGPVVTDPKQAYAIAMSEARQAKAKHPAPAKAKKVVHHSPAMLAVDCGRLKEERAV